MRPILPLSTARSRQDLGIVLLITGFTTLLIPLLLLILLFIEPGLEFSVSMGFIGLAFFISGSIFIVSTPTMD